MIRRSGAGGPMMRSEFWGVSWMRTICLMYVFLSGLSVLSAQDLTIKRASSSIQIDGVMDEEAWQEAEVANNFNQYFPFDTSLADSQTEVRMTYDDRFLYVIAIMQNQGPRDYVVRSLRRDFRGRGYDSFSVVLDTYKDRSNAFVFGINPYGVQREGFITNGGIQTRTQGSSSENNAFTLTWDNKWRSHTRMLDSCWIAEFAIPFNSIRFRDDVDSWYVNFYRVDSEQAERSTWSHIPRNFSLINIGFNKEVQWDQPPQNKGKNISLIPYAGFRTSKNFEEGLPAERAFTAGGDAKIALSTALNLDLTINPDFSQVEADEQVTNLDRFEILFPEQRQFFLENADLFSNFGSDGARPFFSRRIGIVVDTATGTNVTNPLYVGARMTGNLSSKWRLGLMTIQAAPEKDIGIPSINYSVASIQHRIGQRSNIAGILINKQAFVDSLNGSFSWNPTDWNRTLGVDLNLATPDNRWNGKGYFHTSLDPSKLDSTYSAGFEINHETFDWEIRTDIRTIGANFNPDVGFVRRTNFAQWRATGYRNFYPSNKSIQSHGPGLDFDILRHNQFGITDWDANLLYRIDFKNNSRFNLRLRRQYTFLTDPFDPSGSDGLALPAQSDYTYNFMIADYRSDQRKSFFYELSTTNGEYFNGHLLNLEGTLSYRFGIKGTAAMNVAFNRIRLPGEYTDADLVLIGPRIDLTFTRALFWTTFVQYNEQINNVNINTRLQWRFKPASDLFIVYTDSYLAAEEDRIVDFARPKSRALVVKMNYWINL
ncbi:MAG: carbohydrate binding family 9 domain-containing protein [Saprospiraceae bacterium]|nr:carbohydrate binding family 9 domain-containing protein [Saprospiraceae bacterium]